MLGVYVFGCIDCTLAIDSSETMGRVITMILEAAPGITYLNPTQIIVSTKCLFQMSNQSMPSLPCFLYISTMCGTLAFGFNRSGQFVDYFQRT